LDHVFGNVRLNRFTFKGKILPCSYIKRFGSLARR